MNSNMEPAPPPSNLQGSALATTASLSWTENGSSTFWQIEHGAASFTQGSGTKVVTSSNPYSLTGLTAQTDYDFYVRAICGPGDTSGWTGPFAFTTTCGAASLPYTENFDGSGWTAGSGSSTNIGATDPCWIRTPDAFSSNYFWGVNAGTTVSGSTGPNVDKSTGTSTGKYLYTESSNGSAGDVALLELPPFTTTAGNNVVVNFWYHMYGGDIGRLVLDAYINGSWKAIDSIVGQQQTGNAADWLPEEFTVENVGNSLKFRFRGVSDGTFNGDIAIDEISVKELSPCTGTPNAGTASFTKVTCPAPSVTLTSTGYTEGPGITYQWEVTTNGGMTWDPVLGATTPTYTFSPSQANPYRLSVECTNSGSIVESNVINVIPPATTYSGTYTIDSSGGDFNNLAEFAEALSCASITGPVTANVVAGSGPYTEQVVFGEITGVSATNTVTINGNGNAINVDPASDNRAVIQLNGTDFMTIDNLTLTGGSTYGWGVWLTNQADNNTISNCIINMDATSTSSTNFSGIISSSSATSTIGEDNNANNNLIQNNTINGGYYGIRLNGTTTDNSGNRIEGNTIADFYTYGIYLNDQENSVVSGNDISRASRTGVTTFYGVYINSCVGVAVTKNRVHNTHDAATSQTGIAYGIYHNASDGTSANPHLVANNLIYNLNSEDGTVYGIYNSGSDFVKYYHNTVAINNQSATGTDIVRGFYQTTTASDIEFKNNIVYINHSSTGDKHGLYHNLNTSSITSNNNVVFVSGGGSNNFFGEYDNDDHATLSDWQTATSQDASSFETDPLLDGTYSPQEASIDNQGQNLLTDVPDDIAGTARTATPIPVPLSSHHLPVWLLQA